MSSEFLGLRKELQSQNKRFENEDLVLITVMAGGLSYTHEFMKRLDITPLYFDYIARSSYKFGQKMDNPKTFYEGKIDIKGKNVAIVDEIVDSGETMLKLIELLEKYEPKSISVVSIISKPTRVRPPENVKEYYCFEYETEEGALTLTINTDKVKDAIITTYRIFNEGI